MRTIANLALVWGARLIRGYGQAVRRRCKKRLQLGKSALCALRPYQQQRNIKRVEQRIRDLERMSGKQEDGWKFKGGHVEMNAEIMRVQIFFDAIPDVELRSEMKKNGSDGHRLKKHGSDSSRTTVSGCAEYPGAGPDRGNGTACGKTAKRWIMLMK